MDLTTLTKILVTRTELQVILLTMDIPESKYDVSKIENVRWLQRNIGIRNSKHKDINKAIELIKFLLKNS